MRIVKFQEVIRLIGKSSNIQVISESTSHDIANIRLWEHGKSKSNGSTLYFSADAQPTIWPDNFIIVSDCIPEPLHGSPRNLAVIPSDNFAKVFNILQDALTDSSSNKFYNYLVEVADEVKSTEALIDVASQSFNASLILIDRDFRIIGYSTQIPVTDPIWSENIKKGYCDYEFVSEVKKLKSVQMADNSTLPFEVTCPSSPYRKLACRVYCKDAWVGSLILIEGEGTYHCSHKDMLQTLSGIAGYSIIAHSPQLLYRTSNYYNFLYNLLIGTPIENLPEAYRNLKFADTIRLMYFRADNNADNFVKASHVIDRLHKLLPDAHVLSQHNAIIVVSNAAGQPALSDLIEVFPPACAVKVGVSGKFHDIHLLRKALNEAQDALEVGSRLHSDYSVFKFEDYSTYIMLEHLSRTEDISRYSNHVIQQLQRYDEANGTELLHTLSTYVNCNCSIKETAAAMFMHRNSVIYRLNNIRKICDVNLDDPDTQFSIRLSFCILKLGNTES